MDVYSISGSETIFLTVSYIQKYEVSSSVLSICMWMVATSITFRDIASLHFIQRKVSQLQIPLQYIECYQSNEEKLEFGLERNTPYFRRNKWNMTPVFYAIIICFSRLYNPLMFELSILNFPVYLNLS